MYRSRKIIRIACLGTPCDYRTSLVPLIIQSLGYKIDWVSPVWADLLIYGSFYDVNAPRQRWLPRSWRSKAGQWVGWMEKELSKRRLPPVTLFHTAENLRHNHIQADFSISHDLNVNSDRHFRLPYWMELIDWSHEEIIGNANPRYGDLLQLKRLRSPLGDQFLKRPHNAVLITSHMSDSRARCYELLSQFMPVDGMGSYFDAKIRNHHRSGFFKKEVLKNYAFNLCPENSLHPGYLTEKIPEAFASGCLPISFFESKTHSDFNPRAIINLVDYLSGNDSELKEILQSQEILGSYSKEPLLLTNPSIFPLKEWIRGILA